MVCQNFWGNEKLNISEHSAQKEMVTQFTQLIFTLDTCNKSTTSPQKHVDMVELALVWAEMSKLNFTGIQDSKPTHCILFHFVQVASL
jgi:hypothetical protein